MLDIEASCKLKHADEGPCHGHVVSLQMQRVMAKTPPHFAYSGLSIGSRWACECPGRQLCVRVGPCRCIPSTRGSMMSGSPWGAGELECEIRQGRAVVCLTGGLQLVSIRTMCRD